MHEQLFDLDQLVPPEVPFKVRGRTILIAPVFSAADYGRYERIEVQLAQGQLYAAQVELARAQYEQAVRDAAESGEQPPAAFAPPERPEGQAIYTDAMFQRDVFGLLLRVWQASEAGKPVSEREAITAATVEETFNERQCWVALQQLFPRRYGQRSPTPTQQPSAVPPEPEPVKVARRRSGKSSMSSAS